jgi:hypothetical protein
MKRFPLKIDKQMVVTSFLMLAFIFINISGYMLNNAWSADDVDEPVEDLSLDEQHQASKALSSDQESLKRLFNVLDADKAIDDSGALEKRGGEEDARRVEDILKGNFTDEDLHEDGPLGLLSKVSSLTERSDIQSKIAYESSISAYEASIWDQQTKLISDKMQELSKERDKISKQWFADLQAADYASSYLNNLPPD